MAGLDPAIYRGTGVANMAGTSPAMMDEATRAARQSFCRLA
jgi:hypothetical protein